MKKTEDYLEFMKNFMGGALETMRDRMSSPGGVDGMLIVMYELRNKVAEAIRILEEVKERRSEAENLRSHCGPGGVEGDSKEKSEEA